MGYSPTTILSKILSLVGVTVFCFAVVQLSSITIVSRSFSIAHSFHFVQFEHHFWQYLFAFIAVIFLSRGHLWSYGINSKNLKTSMKWLSVLYGFTILITMISILLSKEILPISSAHLPKSDKETIMAMLVFWMSSPVANQIVFFSFAQTVLMKQWGDSLMIGRIPVVVIVSALLFTYGATTSQFFIGEYSLAFTFLLGMFCGLVYWKTNSLIAPMLGQAFYFGFPFFIHLFNSDGIK